MPPITSVAAAVARARPLLRARSVLVAADFDGTLALLHPDPWGARMLPAARTALRAMASIPNVHVALISGRTVPDLAARTRVGGIAYLGDHGVERAVAPRGFRPGSLRVAFQPASEAEVDMSTLLAREVPRLVARHWLVVERKSASVAFHFRAAPDIPAARDHVRDAVEEVDPLGVLMRHQGRSVLELRPGSASTKGDAMRRLIGELRPGAALMMGDDRHDAEAFRALRDARDSGRLDGLSIAVAGHPDVTRDVAPQADLTLASPIDTARFLTALAAALPPPVARPAGD